MAIKLARQCDFQDCTEEASVFLEMKRDDVVYRADLCPDSADLLMETIAFRSIAGLAHGKVRDVYTAASGATFTAMEARPWLIEQGLITSGSRGRVKGDFLELYAAAH